MTTVRSGHAARFLLPLALLAALAGAPAILSTYERSLALAILADIALAVSWAFFSGPSRYLSLATGAFFGAGAYTTALVGARLPWPHPFPSPVIARRDRAIHSASGAARAVSAA